MRLLFICLVLLSLGKEANSIEFDVKVNDKEDTQSLVWGRYNLAFNQGFFLDSLISNQILDISLDKDSMLDSDVYTKFDRQINHLVPDNDDIDSLGKNLFIHGLSSFLYGGNLTKSNEIANQQIHDYKSFSVANMFYIKNWEKIYLGFFSPIGYSQNNASISLYDGRNNNLHYDYLTKYYFGAGIFFKYDFSNYLNIRSYYLPNLASMRIFNTYNKGIKDSETYLYSNSSALFNNFGFSIGFNIELFEILQVSQDFKVQFSNSNAILASHFLYHPPNDNSRHIESISGVNSSANNLMFVTKTGLRIYQEFISKDLKWGVEFLSNVSLGFDIASNVDVDYNVVFGKSKDKEYHNQQRYRNKQSMVDSSDNMFFISPNFSIKLNYNDYLSVYYNLGVNILSNRNNNITFGNSFGLLIQM